MRFTELYIHAYGCFCDRLLRLGDGLSVVFGPNESGKSTLKDFVETVLYGFSPASPSHSYWPWTAGGRDFGGELAYELETGAMFRVRRHLELRGRRAREVAEVREGLDGGGAAASVRPDALGEVHVRQRRSIWRNVFAIDLAALIDSAEMSKSDRRHLEQVFFREMAALGTIANPKTVLHDLAEELAAMKLRPGSGRRKKGEIDAFRVTQLAEARNERRAAQERHRRIRELQEEIENLGVELRAAHRQRAGLNARIEASTQRMPLRELFEQWQEARRLLSEGGDVRYDEQVGIQLAADLAHQQEVAGSLERAKADAVALRSQLKRVHAESQADGVLLEQAAAIESLAREADHVERGRRECLAADRAWQEESRRLFDTLRPLVRSDDPRESGALRLTPEEADGFLAEVERWTALDGQVADAQRQVHELDEQRERLSRQADELRERLPDDMPGDYRPSQLHEAVETGRVLDQVEARQAQAAELDERLRDEDSRLKQIRKQVADGSGRTTAAAPTAWTVAAVIALVLGAAAAGYYFWQGQIDAALLPTALGVSGVGVLVYAFRRRRSALMAEDLVQESELLKGQLHRLEALQQQKQAHDERLAALTGELGERWAALSLPGSPNRKAWDERLASLRRFDDARADALACEAVVRQREELQQKHDAAQRRLEALAHQRTTLVAELRNHAAEFDLAWDDDVSPTRARTMVLTAARTTSEWRSLAEARRRLAAQRTEYEQFDARYGSLCAAVGEAFPAEGGPADCLARWEENLQAARRRRQETERLDARLREAQDRLDGLAETAEGMERRIAQACAQLGIDKPADLPRAREHARQIEQLRHRERTLADAFEHQRRLAKLPEGWTPDRPSPEQRDTDSAAEGVTDKAEPVGHAELIALREEQEARIEQLGQRLRSLQTLCEEEAAGPSIAMAAGSLEAAHDKLATMCERYDVLLVAHRLLDSALQEFQRERQPRIINRAQHYLERLTAGRRRRLEADLLSPLRGPRDASETAPLQLVPASGRPRPIAQFSRGTREQAYLALRLALADELDAGERLPLILDDVLVNFDDERAASAAATLAELAQTRQLIYLTCHEQTRAVLESAGAQVLTLETPGVVSGSPASLTQTT